MWYTLESVSFSHSGGDMFTTPELMRVVMRKKPDVLTGLSPDDKISLLGYLLSDSKYTEMKGQSDSTWLI